MPKIVNQFCFVLLSCAMLSIASLCAQESVDKAAFFIEPSAHYALVVPNYGSAPKAGSVYAGSLSLGFQTRKDSSWQSYFGYPQTGVQFTYLHVENQLDLGTQYSLNPFITFNRPFGKKHSLDFKLGLGVAYHTNPFDSISNVENLAIGSPLTWYFNANAYYRVVVSKRLHLKIGGGFWHASNGHTSLPNFGQNYAAFGIGAQYYPALVNEYTKYERTPIDRTKYYYLRLGIGVGLQEYGGTSGPLNDPKYQITNSSLGLGILFRKYLLLQTGIGYRYYSSYAKSQLRNEFVDFKGSKIAAASNLFVFLGTELLFGHVGMDIQGGLNLWKPYFTHFYDEYEPRSKFDRAMKVLFSTRVGLNLYAINTAKVPKHNVSLGAFLHANYGQADYTSVILKYAVRLN